MAVFEELSKQIIIEYLDFIKFKVLNDTLTCEEADSLLKTFQENLTLTGTSDDFAKFYGKTKTNVTTVIDRKMVSKPKRVTVYSFKEFQKIVPKSWHHK